MLLPGEKAALFRYKASNILVRYLACDLSLIPEIEKNIMKFISKIQIILDLDI